MQITGNIAPPLFDPTAPVIRFSNNNYGATLLNHDDPMLITAMIGNTEVRRVFVDQGSSTNILFYEAIKK